ncbi:MAG: dolichyl-diphosphooligosaccharide--protein glycosyltransferase subunit STT3, partial [Candidatus Bathyarchaeota archaeon]|nr:dolichyl-diphosphooligosaccharide--protein glycosyltransferase subunit STT3 [Candidatus Bathyarchaeota archaeon]
LFLVSLYFIIGATQLINLIINLTAGNNIGTFFEFINISTDRALVYILSCITIISITAKDRKILPTILSIAYFLASYIATIQALDLITISLSFVALVWFLTSPKPFTTMNRKKAVSHVLVYTILILVVVEVAALVCWFSFPFVPNLSQQGTCRYLVEQETKMFILAGSLAPILTVIVLFSWITKPLFPKIRSLKQFLLLFTEKDSEPNGNTKNQLQTMLLLCTIILSFLVTAYPFSPALKVNANPIGVDVQEYQNWLTNAENSNFFEATSAFFFERPDRALSLVFLYTAKVVTGAPSSNVVQFFPMILAPALVFAVYFFVNETKPNRTSLLTAFFAVFSFHICVGLYGFYLSNWMALIELYFFMGVYFGGLRKKSVYRMLVALVLSVALLFTHSSTWAMSMGVILAHFLLTMLHHRKNLATNKYEIKVLTAIIVINILVLVARNLALQVPLTQFETATLAQSNVSISGLGSFWSDLSYTFFNTHYGFFVNPMALLLAAVGGFITVFDYKPENRYLTAWLLGSCLFFVFGAGWMIKSRILLNLPLPVFEAIGLVGVTRMINKIFDQNKTATINNLTVAFVVLTGLNYAFRCAFELSQLG